MIEEQVEIRSLRQEASEKVTQKHRLRNAVAVDDDGERSVDTIPSRRVTKLSRNAADVDDDDDYAADVDDDDDNDGNEGENVKKRHRRRSAAVVGGGNIRPMTIFYQGITTFIQVREATHIENLQREALHNAVRRNVVDDVDSLLAKGTHIDAADQEGTALHLAAKLGFDHIVSFLIERGADIEAKNWLNNSPLHTATENYQTEIVSLLLDKGADIEAKNQTGFTPLHYAAILCRTEIIELLLGRGADIEAKDKKGNTALDVSFDSEVILLLQQESEKRKRCEVM